MDKKEEKTEDIINSSSNFDERRKVLVHKTIQDKKNDLGDLKITTTAEIHEEGIRKTLKDLGKRKEHLKESIKSFEDVLGPVPEMTPELQKLKDDLTTLQLITHKENAISESVKKEEEQLKNCQKDLKMVDKDIREIKDAVGSRLKL